MTELRTLREIEKVFNQKLKTKVKKWVDGSAENGYTTKKNRDIYRKISLIPRVLKDIKKVNIESNFFGQKISSPLLIAPMGGLTQFNKKAELLISNSSEEKCIPYFFPDNSAYYLKEIYKKNKKYLQSYLHLDSDLEYCKMHLDQAEKYNCRTIGINVDSPIRPVSYNKIDTGYDARKFVLRLPRYYKRKKSEPLNWKILEKIRKLTKKPIILKGILSVEDAILSSKIGVNSIWVTNHGGRVLESDLTSLEQLPKIKNKLSKKLKIIVDGGVRSGSDIIKCLSLGADYVAIGRPIIYGLIANSNIGVSRVLELFMNELKISLRLCGFEKISELSNKNIINNFNEN